MELVIGSYLGKINNQVHSFIHSFVCSFTKYLVRASILLDSMRNTKMKQAEILSSKVL